MKCAAAGISCLRVTFAFTLAWAHSPRWTSPYAGRRAPRKPSRRLRPTSGSLYARVRESSHDIHSRVLRTPSINDSCCVLSKNGETVPTSLPSISELPLLVAIPSPVDDLLKLVKTLNCALGEEALSDFQIQEALAALWAQLETPKRPWAWPQFGCRHCAAFIAHARTLNLADAEGRQTIPFIREVCV